MRSLPMPEQGGSIDQLRPFVNVGCEEDFRLLVGWLVAALRPGVPVPVLVLNGEAGSAKSTTTRVLRQLTDPKEPAIYSPPREDRDLVSAARHNQVLAFDNLSHIDQRLSDALCRLCTGGGQGGRKLFTDDEEATFEAKRPIIINGIPDLATHQDLASRSIVMALPPIPTDRRQSEASFWEAFEAVRPKLFGCLLDALSCALRHKETVTLECRPRMADFLEFVTAAEEALGWPDGSLLAAYRQNEERANEIAIESDLVAVAMCQLVDHVDPWNGTATELQTALRIYGGDFVQDRRLWPQAPNKLSGRVRRAAPALRKIGIEVSYARRGAAGQTVFDIRKVPESILSTVSIVSSTSGPACGNGRKQPFRISTDDTEDTDDKFMDPNTWGV